jgi:hypothetical protein
MSEMDSPNASQHNDFRHISSMDGCGDFNRKKIANLCPEQPRRHIGSAEYGEKDTRQGKFLENIATHRGY